MMVDKDNAHPFMNPYQGFLSHGGSPVVTMVVSILSLSLMTWMIWGYPHELEIQKKIGHPNTTHLSDPVVQLTLEAETSVSSPSSKTMTRWKKQRSTADPSTWGCQGDADYGRRTLLSQPARPSLPLSAQRWCAPRVAWRCPQNSQLCRHA